MSWCLIKQKDTSLWRDTFSAEGHLYSHMSQISDIEAYPYNYCKRTDVLCA